MGEVKKCICGVVPHVRQRSSPTGNCDWSVLVDVCSCCGYLYPVHFEGLTYKQKHWIERWNTRALDSYIKKVAEERFKLISKRHWEKFLNEWEQKRLDELTEVLNKINSRVTPEEFEILKKMEQKLEESKSNLKRVKEKLEENGD